MTTLEAARPPEPPGPLAWMRKNLFSNWYNSLLTLVTLALTFWAGMGFIRWAFTTANWEPVTRFLILYLVGQYPRGDLWRLEIGLALVSLLFGVSWRLWGGAMRMFASIHAIFLLGVALWPTAAEAVTLEMRVVMFANLALILVGFLIGGARFLNGRAVLIAWLVVLALTLVLVHGLPGAGWLAVIPTSLWGGLMVTLILAVGGIALSFPIGVLLALGRRSSLPVVSLSSAVFIEVIRGIPLVGVLFLASLIVPLFLPPEIRVDRLLRALVGITIFTAAYMAENVRGGLAAVPPGQEEAARALGLNGFYTTAFIVLPQALRAVIPPMVGQFISLFKDTTLASGVAVLEFLAIGRSILQANPEYIGLQMEVFLFIAAVYWIFCYLMSYASLRLENALGVGKR